ncbi:mybB, partial [Acrasis kona]
VAISEDPDSKKNLNKRLRNRSKTCQRWTEEQNKDLREAVLKHGPRNWKKIAVEIGGLFTADQCNQHWHRVLNPRIIK